MPQKQVYD